MWLLIQVRNRSDKHISTFYRRISLYEGKLSHYDYSSYQQCLCVEHVMLYPFSRFPAILFYGSQCWGKWWTPCSKGKWEVTWLSSLQSFSLNVIIHPPEWCDGIFYTDADWPLYLRQIAHFTSSRGHGGQTPVTISSGTELFQTAQCVISAHHRTLDK